MTKEEIAKILENHKKWLIDGKGERADLRGANLRGANLEGANLDSANLDSANLGSANLEGANLDSANLDSANLGGANLWGADLERANLEGANLDSANLDSANLDSANLGGANLRGANLEGANLEGANLEGANLRGAKGNMAEIKSMQFEEWPVTWTAEVMQIGCQRHSLELWRKSDPRWIAALDSHAAEWWNKFGAIVLALIEASPAKPTRDFQKRANLLDLMLDDHQERA